MDYKEILEHSYKVVAETFECPPKSRLEYLGEYIFGFITYDPEMSSLFALKAVEVCKAINNRSTFEYIQEPTNYSWFLLMCNMVFFAERLEWGTSIRGAWWEAMPGRQMEFQSNGLWTGDKQIDQTIKFSREEWDKFIIAVVEFASDEMKQHNVKVTSGSQVDRNTRGQNAN